MTTKKLVRCALVAALYTVLCLAFAPLSFGAVQLRFAEALCLLPVLGAEYIAAVTLGCFLTNLLGSSMVDLLLGTLATLLGCLGTYLLRRKPLLVAALPPVFCNATIVGGIVISLFFAEGAVTVPVVLMNIFTVGLGEWISCGVLGVLLVRTIQKNKTLHPLFTQ